MLLILNLTFRPREIGDLNKAIYSGMYYISSINFPNAPKTDFVGHMIVITPYGTATRGMQIAFGLYDNTGNYKRLIAADDKGNYSFGNWIGF